MIDTRAPVSQKNKKPIKFGEAEQRLEAARVALERVWAPSAEETHRILQTRALILAQEPPSHKAVDDGIDALEFILAHESYAVETHYVRQVASLENLTPLPCTPAVVLGIVNLRGAILPVIDLKNFFELPAKGLTDLNKIIVLQSGKILFGIVADSIVGVRNISAAAIQPSLPTLTGIRKDYLKGITPERVALLDAGKLIAAENIVVQEQVIE